MAALTLVVMLFGGCLPDNTPPLFGDAVSPSCGNGVCDVLSEDCDTCPGDCECCAITSCEGRVSADGGDPILVAGQPDGQTVELDESSDLLMVFGREIIDRREAGALEIEIHGEVTSQQNSKDTTTQSSICTQQMAQGGAFEVLVSADGAVWTTVGIWANVNGQQHHQFDAACGGTSNVRWIRIQGQPGASARLDAITAINTNLEDPSCIDELQTLSE